MSRLHILAALQDLSVSNSLLVAVPASMIVSGIILLVGFYFVHRRFIHVEFPGYVQRVEERLVSLIRNTEKMEDSLVKLTVMLERHEARFDMHEWRLRQLERMNGLRHEEDEPGGRQ